MTGHVLLHLSRTATLTRSLKFRRPSRLVEILSTRSSLVIRKAKCQFVCRRTKEATACKVLLYGPSPVRGDAKEREEDIKNELHIIQTLQRKDHPSIVPFLSLNERE